jgi:hypothetical protein
MNPSEWTNAVKATVVAAVNAFMGLVLALAIFFNLDISVENYAAVSLAVATFVNTIAGLWILLTYRDSPTRATPEVLEQRGLTP